VKVRRTEEKCVHCRACSRHCPSLLDVEQMDLVSSPECFGCLTCVSRCPSPGAIDLAVGFGKNRRTLRPLVYPVLLFLLFYGGIGVGMLTDTWQSKVHYDDYRKIIPAMHGAQPGRTTNAKSGREAAVPEGTAEAGGPTGRAPRKADH